MELNTVIFSDFVQIAEVLWEKGKASVSPVMRKSGMVMVDKISQSTGNQREWSSVDTNEYLSYKGESDQAARGKVQQGYSKTMTAYRIAENIGISYEMRTQNKYPEVTRNLTSAGRKGDQSIELDLSHRFTFGTATSYTDRDGRTIDITTGASSSQQLFDTNHPLKGCSTTYRNRLANNPKVSKGALEGMERLVVEETYNQLGEKKTMSFDVIFSTDDPNTVNTIREYLRSTSAPDGANSGITNVYSSKYRHVIMPLLATTAAGATDSDKRFYWGLVCTQNSEFHLGVWEEPHMISPSGKGSEDIQTDDWEFRNRAGYGICVVDAPWIKFSSGDGTA